MLQTTVIDMEWDWENLDIFSSKAVTIASPEKLQSTEDNVAGGSPPSFELEGSVCSSGQSIGLKLGKRTYFGNNFGNNSTKTCNSPNVSVSTVKKVKLSQQSTLITWCQVEGCNLDLSSSKEYHRKHKVCEIHSKSLKVVVAGIERRFCQQCSRFHGLAEFDGIKRSCRRRLSDHNARRRKPQQDTIQFNSTTFSSSFYDRQQQQQQLSFVFNNVPSVKTGDQFPNAVCTAGVFYQGSDDEGLDLHRALSLLSNSSWDSDFSGLDHHSISTTNGPTMAAHHGSPPGYWQLNHHPIEHATQFQESQVLKPPYGMQ